jgi:predicted transposase/invertase (TIGR01784 family)
MSKKLLSMKNDYVFKRVFADPNNVDALADFLKAALTLPEEEYGSIEIVDPHIQRRFADDKLGILDVKLHTATGNIIHIEIQVEKEECFRERIVDYLARLLVDQMVRGGDYGDLRRVISIVITDFILIAENDNYRNRYLLADCDTGSIFSDIRFAFIDMASPCGVAVR